MKKHEILFWIIKLPIEFIIVFISFFLARSLRLITDLIPKVQLPIKTINTEFLIIFALLWSILFILIFSFSWLYKIKTTNSKIKEFFDIIAKSILWFIIYISILYLANWYLYKVEIPRLIIFFTLIFSIIFIILERFLLNKIQHHLLERWILEKTNILLILNTIEQELLNELKKSNLYKIVWYINTKKIAWINIAYLWNEKDLWEKLQKYKINEIFFVNSNFRQDQLIQIFEYSRIYWVNYKYVASVFDISKSNTETSFLDKFPIVEIKSIWLNPWGRVIKRLFDILASIFFIIICSIPMIMIWILIKIEDPAWPIIFKNRRVWKNWKIFDVYKFRYMKWEFCVKDAYWVDSDKDNALKLEQKLIKEKSTRKWPLYKIQNDPRKMKIWNFIERFSIDELPQFFNVLIWNMSLVWPRPHQPREVALYKEYQKRVLTIKPGITWMGQVHWRHENDFDDEVKLDIFYIENWNILLDLKILFRTLKVIIKR